MRVNWTNKTPGFDDPTEDTVRGNALHIVVYAHGQYRQLYLDLPQLEAQQRFESWMMKRNRFEILVEGWEATIESIRLVDGEAWIGDARADLQLMTDLMLKAAASQGHAA